MKTALRKLLVGVAGLVIETLSISKEQLVAQRQQISALRRVHKCERDFYMASQSDNTHVIEQARNLCDDARKSFNNLYQKSHELQ